MRFAVAAYLLLEAFLTLAIASRLGAAPSLLLLLLGAVAGIAILRRETLTILARLRRTIAAGEPILTEALDGALCAIAGVLLIIPGFISDAAAAGLLIPRVRQFLIRRLSAAFGHRRDAGAVVIEGDYRSIDDRALPEPKQGLR